MIFVVSAVSLSRLATLNFVRRVFVSPASSSSVENDWYSNARACARSLPRLEWGPCASAASRRRCLESSRRCQNTMSVAPFARTVLRRLV